MNDKKPTSTALLPEFLEAQLRKPANRGLHHTTTSKLNRRMLQILAVVPVAPSPTLGVANYE